MVTFGSVKEKEYTLIEQGEYVLTLHELEESEGQWGDRMIWKFLVAPKEDYSAYICKANGEEYTVWCFTDRDIVVGSQGHEFVQTLTGRSFDKGSEPPDEEDLIGKRMLAYITHETPTRGKNAGKKREAIVAGSCKRFAGPAKKVAPNLPPPATPTEDEAKRATLIARVESLTGRAVKLNTPKHLDWVSLDPSTMELDELTKKANEISEEVLTALDA